MTLVLRLVPAVLLWACVLKRWTTVRQGHTQRVLWLTLATCAVAATLDLPAVAPFLDRLTGAGPNVANLVKHLTVLVAALAATEVVRGFAMPPTEAKQGARRRLVVLVVADASLVLLFTAAPVHNAEQSGLTASFATDPRMLTYWAVYLTYLGTALVSIVQLTRWYLRRAAAGALRAGLSAIGLGAIVGLAYVAHKALYLLVRLAGVTTGPVVQSMEGVESVLLGVCIVLLVAGVSWPTLSQHPLLCRAAAHRAHRALRPLWQDLTAATPEVRLPQAAQDIESTLYNQIIEIRDATLALRPYAPARLLDRARQEARALGVPARHLDAATEAAWLEVARRRKLRGVEPHGETIPRSHGAVDLDGETHVLMDLARHRRIGARAADRLDAALDTQDSKTA